MRNRIVGNGSGYSGITLSESGAIVKSNWIYNNYDGVRCFNSSSAVVRNNTIVGSTRYGIWRMEAVRIANAYKHLYTFSYVDISSTGAIDLLEINNENVSEVTTNYSKVIYTKRTGEQRDLLPILENVVNFWQKEVYKFSRDIEIIPRQNKDSISKNNSE